VGTYLYRTENVNVQSAGQGISTFTHGLGVAPAGENGEVFIRHRTFTNVVTVLLSNSQVVSLQASANPVNVDLTVLAFHSIIK